MVCNAFFAYLSGICKVKVITCLAIPALEKAMIRFELNYEASEWLPRLVCISNAFTNYTKCSCHDAYSISGKSKPNIDAFFLGKII